MRRMHVFIRSRFLKRTQRILPAPLENSPLSVVCVFNVELEIRKPIHPSCLSESSQLMQSDGSTNQLAGCQTVQMEEEMPESPTEHSPDLSKDGHAADGIGRLHMFEKFEF